MASLLDFIFDGLDIENLTREEVKQYLRYLNEIVPQLTSEDQKIKFLKSKVRLNRQLIALDTGLMTNE